MAFHKQSVAIVGAGPAGLVTARTLLRTGKFDVTVFEKSSCIGGLWSPKGNIDPRMTTNLCKFTVSFSGLSWDSVDAGRDGLPVAMYPKAWQVNEYLLEYCRRYVPRDNIRFNTVVVQAIGTAPEPGQRGNTGWKIETVSAHGSEVAEVHHFNRLVVVSGPFSRPQNLKDDVVSQVLDTSSVRSIHSTECRQLSDLIPEYVEEPSSMAKLLVVGGSHSGSEAATKIALELCSQSDADRKTSYQVVNLTSRRLFALSPLLACEHSGAQAFEPADFQLYNRSSRPAEPVIKFAYATFDREKHKGMAKALKSLTGDDDTAKDEECLEQLQLSAVVSEVYSSLARDGIIRQEQGKLLRLEPSHSASSVNAIFRSPSGQEQTIENIAGIVNATGFNTAASLGFLSDDVKALLEYDASDPQYPALLDTSYISQNANVPDLAIIGFAEFYWAIMELQARAVAQAWGQNHVVPSLEDRTNLAAFQRKIRAQRKARQRADIHPYPLGDYVGLTEQAARELHLLRVDGQWTRTEGPICAARYLDRNASPQEQDEARKSIASLQSIHADRPSAMKFIAKAVFYALLGTWSNHTPGLTYTSLQPPNTSLRFFPRLRGDADVGFEYLRIRDAASTVWRYDDLTGSMSICSARPASPHAARDHLASLAFIEPWYPFAAV